MARVLPNQKSFLLHDEVLAYREKVFFWRRSDPPVIEPHVDDKEYTVKELDRIENLASRELGDVDYDWVIMRRNNILLADIQLVPGQVIFIPTLRSLKERRVLP